MEERRTPAVGLGVMSQRTETGDIPASGMHTPGRIEGLNGSVDETAPPNDPAHLGTA